MQEPVARQGAVPPSRLHALGLIYEVVICFEIALTMMWEWSQVKGHLPSSENHVSVDETADRIARTLCSTFNRAVSMTMRSPSHAR